MRGGLLSGAILAASLMGMNACSPARADLALTAEQRIHAATVLIADRCAGVVLEGSERVLTAAHCINPGEREIGITYQEGQEEVAKVSAVDRTRDVAILELPRIAPVIGLSVSEQLPGPGTEALFAGRPDRGAELQQVSIERLGRCPSLPGVATALFTTMRGAPGDSGAPVVDEKLEVIGLVHGGAACSVAAPTHEVAAMIDELEHPSASVAERGGATDVPRPRAGRALRAR